MKKIVEAFFPEILILSGKNNIDNWQYWRAGFIFIKLHSIHPGSRHYGFIVKLLFHKKIFAVENFDGLELNKMFNDQ